MPCANDHNSPLNCSCWVLDAQAPAQVVLEGLVGLMAEGVGLGSTEQPTAQHLRLATIAATLLAQLAECRRELGARAADSAAVPCLAALLNTTPRLDSRVRSSFSLPQEPCHELHSWSCSWQHYSPEAGMCEMSDRVASL